MFRSHVRPGSPARIRRHNSGVARDHDVGQEPLREIECARSPGGAEDREAVVAELLLDVLPRARLALCEEDGVRAHAGDARGARPAPPDVLWVICVTIRPQPSGRAAYGIAQPQRERNRVPRAGRRAGRRTARALPARLPRARALVAAPTARPRRRRVSSGRPRSAWLRRRPSCRGRTTSRTLVDDTAALISALGRERAIIVGHDWGGAVAWSVAALASLACREARRAQLPAPAGARPGDACAHRPSCGGRGTSSSSSCRGSRSGAWPRTAPRSSPARSSAARTDGVSGRATRCRAYRIAFARPGRAKAAIDWYRASFRRSLRPRRPRGRRPRRGADAGPLGRRGPLPRARARRAGALAPLAGRGQRADGGPDRRRRALRPERGAGTRERRAAPLARAGGMSSVLAVALAAAWIAGSPLSVPRSEVAAAPYLGRIVVVGGFLETGASSRRVDAYDPRAGRVDASARPPGLR